MEETIDFNNEPVHYCSQCLYLGNPKEVEFAGTTVEYCPYCGSTDFEDSHIEEWENKFETKYKQGKYLNIKKPWRKIMEEMNRR